MRSLVTFYWDAFRIALASILEHKLRAFLTLIGIIIGVAAVVVVGASISGLKTYVVSQGSKVFGSNHFMLTRMAMMDRVSEEEYDRRNRVYKDVTWEEFEHIRDNCARCSYVGAAMRTNSDLKEGTIEMPATRIFGATSSMYEVEDKTITSGRFFSAEEAERSARVAVIGTDVADKFFAGSDPIGQTIRVRGVPLKVIGLEQKRGSIFGDSQDRHLYIPLKLFMQLFSRSGGLQVHGKTILREDLIPAMEEATLLLRNRRHLMGSDENNFSTVNVDDLSKTMDQITGAIAGVVIPITLIILVVGGIVVMNIMLVSVTERTFEVGLRKAIGATRKQIMLQFLIESALLCIVGGTLGLLVAAALTSLLSYLLEITMTITPGYILLAVSVSSLIGIIAGLYPAWKASRLDPIAALTAN